MTQVTHTFITREYTGNVYDQDGTVQTQGDYFGPFRERIHIAHPVSRVEVECMMTAQLRATRGADPVFVERVTSDLIPGCPDLGVVLTGSLGQRNTPIVFPFRSQHLINGEYSFNVLGPSGERDFAVTDTVLAIRLSFYE